MQKKKGQIGELQAIVPILLGVAIVLVVGFLILAEAKDKVIDIQTTDFCGNSLSFNSSDGVVKSYMFYNGTAVTDWNHTGTANLTFAYNGTSTTQSALSDIPGWVPIIVIVIIGSILLGLVAYFRQR